MENTKVSFSLQHQRNVEEENVGYPDGWCENPIFFRNI